MPTDLSIVVVEDNDMLRDEMVGFLARQGWQAAGVDCGEELNDWLGKNTPDIAVLDVNLPYEDGYSIATRLRQSHPQLGLIVLTARVRHSDRAAGYRSGADVYLTKPTHADELVAVITNLSQRLYRDAPSQFELDRALGKLTSPSGQSCLLTGLELRLLMILVMQPERTAEREFLCEAIGRATERDFTPENLAVLLTRLRSKCKQGLSVDSIVVADRGVGYRLCVPLRLM